MSYLDIAFETFGASRSMIGSDWPVCLLASSYSRALDVVRDHLQRQPVETRDPVLGGNAQRSWRLKA
jgi:L-fuconolactonase